MLHSVIALFDAGHQ